MTLSGAGWYAVATTACGPSTSGPLLVAHVEPDGAAAAARHAAGARSKPAVHCLPAEPRQPRYPAPPVTRSFTDGLLHDGGPLSRPGLPQCASESTQHPRKGPCHGHAAGAPRCVLDPAQPAAWRAKPDVRRARSRGSQRQFARRAVSRRRSSPGRRVHESTAMAVPRLGCSFAPAAPRDPLEERLRLGRPPPASREARRNLPLRCRRGSRNCETTSAAPPVSSRLRSKLTSPKDAKAAHGRRRLLRRRGRPREGRRGRSWPRRALRSRAGTRPSCRDPLLEFPDSRPAAVRARAAVSSRACLPRSPRGRRQRPSARSRPRSR